MKQCGLVLIITSSRSHLRLCARSQLLLRLLNRIGVRAACMRTTRLGKGPHYSSLGVSTTADARGKKKIKKDRVKKWWQKCLHGCMATVR